MKGLVRKIAASCLLAVGALSQSCSTMDVVDYAASKALGVPYATTKATRKAGTAALKSTNKALKAHRKQAKAYAANQKRARANQRAVQMMRGGRNYGVY